MIILSILALFENLFICSNFAISDEVISICKDVAHVIILIFFLSTHRNEFSSLDIKKPQKIFVVLSVFLGFLLLSLGSAITDLISIIIPDFYSQNTEIAEYSTVYMVYFFIYAGILAPIVEEIEFRRLLLDNLSSKSMRQTVSTILAAAVMFFSIHTDQFNFGALCLGIVSGLVYYYTRNLTYSIIILFSGNFTVCFLALLQFFTSENTADTSENIDYQELSFVFSLLHSIIILMIISFIMKYFHDKKTECIIR